MAPLEKHIAQKLESNVPEDKNALVSLNEREKALREMIKERFREGPRKNAVASGRMEAIRSLNESEEHKSEEKNIRRTPEEQRGDRLKSYAEIDESKESLSQAAYDEIFSFEYNAEKYKGAGGWQEEYMTALDEHSLPLRDKQTLEEFIMEKQNQELDNIRRTLLEFRINKSLTDIYADLKGDENKEKREKKAAETFKTADQYFLANKDDVEQFFKAEGEAKDKIKTKLLTGFTGTVFDGAKIDDPLVKAAIEKLFDQLLDDYKQMLVSRESLSSLNDVMVANMGKDGMDEKTWREALEKKAGEEAEKLKKQQQQKEQVQVAATTGPVSRGFDLGNYGYASINAGEKLAVNTDIAFINNGNGNFTVVFSPEQGMTDISQFQVRRMPDQDGKPHNVFLFNDALLDNGAAAVDDRMFKRQINSLYLDHVMAQQDRQGKVDGSPDLNNVMPDSEMFEMAKLLFKPVDIEEKPLTREQADVFRNLMLVVAGKTNNQSQTGDYGNLLAIRNRIDLLMYAFKVDNGAKATMCYNYLKRKNLSQLTTVSVEELCRQIGVPKTSGNITHA